jgi:hypothetical protein
MNLHVKTHGHFLKGGHRLIGPGSVVSLDEDIAKEFVKRGLGTLHPGPELDTLPSDSRIPGVPTTDPEHADLGNKLARAEQATAPPQGRRAGAI